MVKHYAEEEDLPVYTGRVKSETFFATFLEDWKPELCLMATFGQKIPPTIFNYPKLGFYNFHHSGDIWPSYPGPDPIAAMVRDGRKHLVLTIHKVTDVIDGGEFVAHSHRVPIPEGINAIEMHRITWPQMGPFIYREVRSILNIASHESVNSPLLLHEKPIAYRAASQHEWLGRIAA
jgi:methionyl-tRNA formyltransferase